MWVKPVLRFKQKLGRRFGQKNTFKGDSNPNDKYIVSTRALWTMNFDTSIIKSVENKEVFGI